MQEDLHRPSGNRCAVEAPYEIREFVGGGVVVHLDGLPIQFDWQRATMASIKVGIGGEISGCVAFDDDWETVIGVADDGSAR